MKKGVQRVFTLCLIMMLLLVFMAAPGYAEKGVNYSDMFNKAQQADGYVAEDVSIELVKAFYNSPLDFIKEASKLDGKQMEVVTDLLTYNACYNNFEKFEDEIGKLNRQSELTTQDKKVIDSILHKIDKCKADIKESESLPKVDSRPAPEFNAETILSFINAHKQRGYGIDEELFASVGKAFRANPQLFAKTVSGLPEDDIKMIAKYIAYDCFKNGNKTKITGTLPTAGDKVLETIYQELSDNKNADIYTFMHDKNEAGQNNQESMSSTVNNQSQVIPTIELISYTSDQLVVGETQELNVIFLEKTSSSITRTYWVEVYGYKNGSSWIKDSKYVSIPAGSTSEKASFSITFTSPGQLDTSIKVYSTRGGQLLTQSKDSYSAAVTGHWFIGVSLPVNRNYKGTLTLYDASGNAVRSFECLGRSASNASMYTTNGNTPTGSYSGYLAGPSSNTYSYGPYKYINMTGTAGVIIDSGRSGIWIHGGDPETNSSLSWYPLRPTNGCVRVSNANQKYLQDTITSFFNSGYDKNGNIYIYQN